MFAVIDGEKNRRNEGQGTQQVNQEGNSPSRLLRHL
jgi:hypothetical protein